MSKRCMGRFTSVSLLVWARRGLVRGEREGPGDSGVADLRAHAAARLHLVGVEGGAAPPSRRGGVHVLLKALGPRGPPHQGRDRLRVALSAGA